MIYAFIGNDREAVHSKSQAWMAAARKKQPELTYVRLTPEEFSVEALLEYVSSSSLFVQKILVTLDEISEGKEFSLLLEHIDTLADSENVFVLIDSGLTPKEKTAVEKAATKTVVCEKKTEGPDWSLFAVGGALAKGDLKGAWVSYVKKRREGIEPEALAGIIHSKIRKLIIEDTTKNWSAYSKYFLDLYHGARRGEMELDEAVEYFLLTCEKSCPPTRT